jgi:hypothetical protein
VRSLVVFRAEGEGFVPPSSKDFDLPPIFGDNEFTTKPIFLILFSVILLSVFFVLASRKALANLFMHMFAMTLEKKLSATNLCASCLICSHSLHLF